MAEEISPETTLDPLPPDMKAVSERTKDFGFLPVPPHLCFRENQPQKFGYVLQLTFVAATTFSEWFLAW